MNEMIIVGKTTSPFGIKGEIKVISDFERASEAFVVGRKILINNKEHTITSIRFHKNKFLMGIDNLDNINLILDFIGFNVYIKRADLALKSDEYLYQDLIGARVIEDECILGVVTEIEKGKASDYLKVKKDTVDFLVPINSHYIIKVLRGEKKIYCKNAKELML